MCSHRETRRFIDRLMDELGVEQYGWTVNGSGHYRVEMVHAGQTLVYVMAATPSDRRSCLNTRSGVRRLLRQAEGSSSRT